MKIERHLQPNCSESVVAIVDWKSKQVVESYETSSDSKEEDTVVDELQRFVDYLNKGYGIDINSNGDNYTPAIYDVAHYIHEHDITIKNWEGLAKAIENSDVQEDQEKIWDYADKLQRFGQGGYKDANKKRATNSGTSV